MREALLVAVSPLHTLVTLLRFKRECRNRASVKAANGNRLPCFLTIPVRLIVNAQ